MLITTSERAHEAARRVTPEANCLKGSWIFAVIGFKPSSILYLNF
jgi:hypothetical protein